MREQKGLEAATSCVTGRCSNQLNDPRSTDLCSLIHESHCRRKAIHSADFSFRQLPIAIGPEDSFCSATAAQEETYATWLYGETQS